MRLVYEIEIKLELVYQVKLPLLEADVKLKQIHQRLKLLSGDQDDRASLEDSWMEGLCAA